MWGPLYNKLANWGPALPGKNLMHFLWSKVFFPVICLGFGVWGTLGSGSRVYGVIFVGVEVCTKFGGEWSSGSQRNTGTSMSINSLFSLCKVCAFHTFKSLIITKFWAYLGLKFKLCLSLPKQSERGSLEFF